MKMSIARALKEKNRLVGQINRTRALLGAENVKSFVVQVKENEPYDSNALLLGAEAKRKVDVAKLEAEWKELEEKLIRLKVAIQKANSGAVETLVRLQEAKSHLSQINEIRYGETEVSSNYPGRVGVTVAKFGQEYQLAETEKYTNLVNELQDKIDEYNATTTVELGG